MSNIFIGNVGKLVPNFFDKEKYALYENLQLYLRIGLKLKEIHRILQLSQPKWLNSYVESNHKKRTEAEKNGGKDGKALYK